MTVDYEIKFWKDYLHSDCLGRLKLIEGLPIRKMINDLENIKNKKLKENMKSRMIAQLLNGYFEDLESAVYTKIRNESEKKSKGRK